MPGKCSLVMESHLRAFAHATAVSRRPRGLAPGCAPALFQGPLAERGPPPEVAAPAPLSSLAFTPSVH